MDKAQLEAKFNRFCSNLKESDNIAIIHHSDADGICSALITAKAIERLAGKRPVAVCPYEYGNIEQGRKAVMEMHRKKANKLVVVDIGIDSAPHGLGEKYSFEECLVIDHHKMYRDLNGKNLVFLKAQFFTKKDPSGYVTSKFAFDLFGKLVDISDLDWVACIGIMGDMNLKRWKQFVRKTIMKRNLSLSWFYSFLELIAAVEVLANSMVTKLFWALYDAEDPEQVLQGPFKKYLERFREERDSLVERFDEKAEYVPALDLYFYAIRSRHENIKSYVINQLSETRPDKTIILIQYLPDGRVRFSARRQDFKVRVNDLLVEAVKGIPEASAGGHAPAAAGSIPKRALTRFKGNIVQILDKTYKK